MVKSIKKMQYCIIFCILDQYFINLRVSDDHQQRKKIKKSTLPETRTRNLSLRRRTPYPLGQQGNLFVLESNMKS